MKFYCIITLLLIVHHINGIDSKLCRLRDLSLKSRELWTYYTGYYCYNYTNIYRLRFKYNTTEVPYNSTIKVPGVKLPNGTYFYYDIFNETSMSYLKQSFKTNDFFQLWRSCGLESVDCCDNFMNGENIYPSKDYPCPAIWDGWTCFGPAEANTIEKMTCPRQAYSTSSDVCELLSEKQCFSNGTWNQKTNYNVCAIAPVLRARHNFNIIFLAVATVFCFPATLIFFSFRKFRSQTRFILHRNLILVIIIRNLFTIMTKSIIIMDELKSSGSNHVMENNGVACRVLAFFENAAKNGMYACMLADGFYLHKLIVRAFADDPKLTYIYAVVFVLTFLPSLIWATARGLHDGKDCWMVDETQDQWIPDGFRIAILAINFLFLLDIIRVMALKLKRSGTSQQTKATLKATLFLIPLFGLHILIITNRNIVTSKTCVAEDIYYYISFIMEGLQGIMVSLLFCYMNTEVIGTIKNTFRKFTLTFEQKFGVQLNKTKNNRRATAATYVDPDNELYC